VRRAWPAILLLFAGCATWRAMFPEPRPYGVPPEAVKIPGLQARVTGVAFSDFVTELAKQTAQGEASVAEDLAVDGGLPPEEVERLRAVWQCWERPDMYDVWVSLDDAGTRYVVDIWPKPEVCLGTETETYGGGAIYEIDVKSFTILKKEMQE
jgi:hypothetical protein